MLEEQNNNLVAYGFLADEDEQTEVVRNRFVQLFRSAADVRRAMACAKPDVQVLICDTSPTLSSGDAATLHSEDPTGAPLPQNSESLLEVSPLNLAAALHKDNPLRDIYLEKANPSALFISRVETAGARGVISKGEAGSLLGIPTEATITQDPVVVDKEPCSLEIPSSQAKHEVQTEPDMSIEPDVHREPGAPLQSSELMQPQMETESGIQKESDVQVEIGIQVEIGMQAAPDPYEESTVEEVLVAQEEFSVMQSEYAAESSQDAQEALDSLYVNEAVCEPNLNPGEVSTDDFAWLEQALELDDLDDAVARSQTALLEKPVIVPAVGAEQQAFQYPVTQLVPENGKGGVVAAFISGRGGVGKSSLTVLTAFDLWQAGFKVVAIDMDLQFGDLGVLAGNERESKIQRLGIEQLCNNRVQIPRLNEALLLVEAPQNPEAAEDLVHQIPHLLFQLKQVADIVLINTSCLWNEALAVLASSADQLIVCMDQRATSVSAARNVVDLCVRLRIPSTKLLYLLNRCARNAPITDIDATLAMRCSEVITIAEGGSDVDELLSLGCPIELLSAQAPLRQSIHKLGLNLLAERATDLGLGVSER